MAKSERPEDNIFSDEPRTLPDHPVTVPGTPELRREYRRFLKRGLRADSAGKMPTDVEQPTARTPEAQQVLDDLQNNPDVITRRIETFLEK